jgi:hypothetical protein
VLFGKHPMAPSVSPKKSWEGFAGSLAACAIAGAIFFWTLFDANPLLGVLYGLAVVGSATLGDLGESMVKRDIGIKDMGTLLPGHGGIMDRLDSLLPTGADRLAAARRPFVPYPAEEAAQGGEAPPAREARGRRRQLGAAAGRAALPLRVGLGEVAGGGGEVGARVAAEPRGAGRDAPDGHPLGAQRVGHPGGVHDVAELVGEHVQQQGSDWRAHERTNRSTRPASRSASPRTSGGPGGRRSGRCGRRRGGARRSWAAWPRRCCQPSPSHCAGRRDGRRPWARRGGCGWARGERPARWSPPGGGGARE